MSGDASVRAGGRGGGLLRLGLGRSVGYFLTFADDRMGTCQEIETKFLYPLCLLLVNILNTHISLMYGKS